MIFPHMFLVGVVEKWEGGKFFCLVGEKNERMENVVYNSEKVRGVGKCNKVRVFV